MHIRCTSDTITNIYLSSVRKSEFELDLFRKRLFAALEFNIQCYIDSMIECTDPLTGRPIIQSHLRWCKPKLDLNAYTKVYSTEPRPVAFLSRSCQ